MSFLHPAILGLLALALVPVLLHLLMRPKPKRMIFPALRLLETRRKTNTRRLRLRHLWLLLLRMLVIGLLVLAIARPVVPAANYGFTASEWLRLAVIAGLAIAAYLAAERFWCRSTAARHQYLYRRTVARGSAGAVFAALVLAAILWPYTRRVAGEIADPTKGPSENQPVMAIFLFDTSGSMEYQQANRSRLAQAQAVAKAHLETLASGSRVAIASTSSPEDLVFLSDLATAGDRIDGLKTTPNRFMLDQKLVQSLQVLREDRRQAQEAAETGQAAADPLVRAVYVFSDLAKSAWNPANAAILKETLEQERWLQLYLVDVGSQNVTNSAITSAQPPQAVVTAGQSVTLPVELAASGDKATDAVVELYLEENGKTVKRGENAVPLTPGSPAKTIFILPAVRAPFVRGEVRLTQTDPLEIDNRRHFTVSVEPNPKVLIVSDQPADGIYWSTSLAPPELVQHGTARYDVKRLTTAELEQADLDAFSVIYLLNVTRPSEATWRRLDRYVRNGGGLGVLLGKRVDVTAYSTAEAKLLLPAVPLTQVAYEPPAHFTPIADTHPVFQRFADLGGFRDLTIRDVYRRYIIEPAADAAILAIYAPDVEARPALLTRSAGAGRVALLTTGVDGDWSDLQKAGWAFLAFSDLLSQYLGGAGTGERNFAAGEVATVTLHNSGGASRALVRTPDLKQYPVDLAQGDDLFFSKTDQIGSYDIALRAGSSAATDGFSVNLPAGESDLTRVTEADLNDWLGEEHYAVAEGPEQLAVAVRDTTIGAELMPYLLVLLVLFFLGESIVSNRFYDADVGSERQQVATATP